MKQKNAITFLLALSIIIISLIAPASFLSIDSLFRTVSPVYAQDNQEGSRPGQTRHASAAVVVKGRRLLTFYSVYQGFTPEQRAQKTSMVVRGLAADPKFDVDSITTQEAPEGTVIISGNEVIATITHEDASMAQSSSSVLAREFAGRLRIALAERIEEVTAGAIAMGVGLTVISLIVLMLSIVLLSRVSTAVCLKLNEWQGTRIKAIRIQEAELLGERALAELLVSLVKFGQMSAILIFVVVFILQSLSFFPGTRHLSRAIVANAVAPLQEAFMHILNYIPHLLMLVVITMITLAVNGFFKFFFNAIRDRSIRFADFDADWAEPSYKLVRFLVVAVAFTVALPFLPGWESPAFKQVGLVLGILVSLGSTGVVGNVMAGAVLTYTNAFKIGDRIKIGDCTGDVISKTLFVTRVQTPKNEIVSVPNATILNSNIVNYSILAKNNQLVLYTAVTIGYDAPWKKVHELLIAAALQCEGVLKTPEPFVLQTALSDFYVSYELNAYVNRANEIPKLYSELHKAIQDKFNEAAVEIMSPHYVCLRDGNRISIPENYLPKDYQSPGFTVSTG